jgi:hypothetical protein
MDIITKNNLKHKRNYILNKIGKKEKARVTRMVVRLIGRRIPSDKSGFFLEEQTNSPEKSENLRFFCGFIKKIFFENF